MTAAEVIATTMVRLMGVQRLDYAVMLVAFFIFVGAGAEVERTNCHHNFTQREIHDGKQLWITRKGAIKADVGDTGVRVLGLPDAATAPAC